MLTKCIKITENGNGKEGNMPLLQQSKAEWTGPDHSSGG